MGVGVNTHYRININTHINLADKIQVLWENVGVNVYMPSSSAQGALLFLLVSCSPAADGFCLRFQLWGNQGVSRYIITHVGMPAELSGACSEHLKSLSRLFRHGVAVRLAEPSSTIEKPVCFLFQIDRSALIFALRFDICVARSALPPAIQHHQSIFSTLSAV